MSEATHRFVFPVTRLNCAGCAVSAEKALKAAPGVENAEVNFATREAIVDAATHARDLVSALQSAGKPAAPIETRLSIEGMHCASCVSQIESALLALPHVTNATVNLADQSAVVHALSPRTSDLINAVAQTGKRAKIQTNLSAAAGDDDVAPARRRAIVAALLTAPVFLVEMGGHAIPAVHHWIHVNVGLQTSWTLQAILALLVILFPARTLLRDGARSLISRAPDMNALVLLGSGAAFGYSCLVLIAPSALPSGARAVYFEAAAVILTLILTGRWMEARARGQTGAAITRLLQLAPDTALRASGENVALSDVVPGDMLKVLPGARIPVDGVVETGSSFVDESMLTGEPLAVSKAQGAPLTGGTLNGTGAMTMRVTSVGDDTALARIIGMVRRAQSTRLPVQTVINRVTAVFVPAVLAVAVVTALAWWFLGPEPRLTHALVASVSVLIIACPCAMGLATPTSIMVGSGRAAQKGVLFRKGAALEQFGRVSMVAFDKTGTLTQGRPEVVAVHVAPTQDEAQALGLAAALEAQSEHPLAAAIMDAAGAAPRPDVTDFETVTGRGAIARVDGTPVMIGSRGWMEEQGIAHAHLSPEHPASTPVYLAAAGTAVALFEIADTVREDAAATISALHDAGVRTALITGDTQASGDAVAKTLGIDTVIAGVLPDGKVAAVEGLRGDGLVAFVGDGINDAPALAAADIGVAVGSSTDVAIEAADIVLMPSATTAVLDAFRLSRATLRNIRQNLFWAFAYNTLLIPVAAGLLYPFFGWQLSPALAAGAMALSSVFVLTNALRLRRA